MINILHIMTKIPVGGVENQLLTVLRTYDRNKYLPVVCSMSDKGKIGAEIEEEGIEVVCLNKFKRSFDWTIISDLYRLIKERDIKIVRTHQFHANFYGRVAAILARVPCIIASVHNLYNRDKKIHRRVINWILAGLSDRVVAVSSAVKEDIIKYDHINKKKIMVINNGIDKELFNSQDRSTMRKELGIPPDVHVIGTVGRLTYQKGQKYLIEALACLKDKFSKIRLMLIGDGPLKDELKDYTKSLGMDDDVMFLGTRRDVPALLSAIDIFVLPSLREGLVNSLLEAMAAARPVIASDIKPIREIVDSEAVGILVPVKNSEKMATSIEVLLNDRSLADKIGRAARQKVLASFDIKRTVSMYSSLFDEILEQKVV